MRGERDSPQRRKGRKGGAEEAQDKHQTFALPSRLSGEEVSKARRLLVTSPPGELKCGLGTETVSLFC